MAPVGQGLIWSEVLVCPFCSQIFSSIRVPVNLICGHAACLSCLHAKPKTCPTDSVPISENVASYPINTAILSILSVPLDSFADQSLSRKCSKSVHSAEVAEIEKNLFLLAGYLRVADSEKGGAVYSDLVSRTIQRKIISILCSALTETEGRIQAMRAIRSLSERIVTELICIVQNTIHLSAYLWSAVRARGCQFLGPAMQEDVLRLILLTLANGELIARKTLVMYIVQTLSEDYPHVSKTCVGHVVQLLYRASCFNVIKRDGESSLMQLKEEFREYESLRREHDSQIVQIALEAGLRISPDQWSSLLYGDPHHRSHMQSIVDKLHSPQLLSHALKELKTNVERNGNNTILQKSLENLNFIAEMDPETDYGWKSMSEALGLIEYVIYEYVSFNKKDVVSGRNCPRGPSCTYAHQQEELRADMEAKNNPYFNNDLEGNHQEVSQDVQEPPQQTFTIHPGPGRMGPPMVSMMPITHEQVIAENGAMMIEGNPQYISMMPMMVPNPLNEIPNDQGIQFQKGPVGIPTQVFVMHPGEPMPNPNHPVIVQNPVHVVGGPAPQPGPNGNFSYQIPQHGQIIGAPPVMYPPTVWSQSISVPPPYCQPEIPTYNQQIRAIVPPPQQIQNHSQPVDCRSRKDSDGTPGSSYSSGKREKLSNDEINLIARRNEVISRLRGIDISKDETPEEDAESHVSFTVANSVLFDEVDFGTNQLDFPPLPITPLPKVPNSVSHAAITEVICNTSNVPWAYSWPIEAKNKANRMPFVRTVCPTTLLRIDSTKPATVQSDCTVMNVKDAIEQPLVTATIQSNNLSPQASYEMVDPCQFTEQLPKVMQSIPLTPDNPQDFVSSSLDQIITVREKISEGIMKTSSSAVENEQLKVELNIASRQLSTLDQQTKQTCLLKELKAIDEKIENLGANLPDSN
ncbi:hypothetical protein FO519_007811 [Halicephalobus sp. NKZ332]|nr:hypothetical protein FO519_007811 [Halicephalobus sp. NKZ332]